MNADPLFLVYISRNTGGGIVMVEVKHLSLRYENFTAVADVSFQIEKQEIFGILGLNGAGKSSLIECMCGLRENFIGDVRICGFNPITEREKINQIVGVQLQETTYPSKAKVKEICELFASMYENSLDYRELLKLMGLFEKRNAYIAKLSGGQKQKLSILLALLPQPKVIFLDELTTGLDPKARREMWQIIKELQKKGMTIVLISHFMDEVQVLCDRILILEKGKTIASGTVSEVISCSGSEENATLEDAFLKLTTDDVALEWGGYPL